MESFYAPFNGWKLELLTLVDHINSQKNLFHYVINSNEGGVIHFEETDLRPNVGDFIKLKYSTDDDDEFDEAGGDSVGSLILKRVDGQIKAIDRMIEQDVPCEDIIIQINAAKTALHKIGQVVLEGHLNHCVKDGIEHGDAEKTIADFAKALEYFSRL